MFNHKTLINVERFSCRYDRVVQSRVVIYLRWSSCYRAVQIEERITNILINSLLKRSQYYFRSYFSILSSADRRKYPLPFDWLLDTSRLLRTLLSVVLTYFRPSSVMTSENLKNANLIQKFNLEVSTFTVFVTVPTSTDPTFSLINFTKCYYKGFTG